MGPATELRTQLPAQSHQLSMVLPLLLPLLVSFQSVLSPVSPTALLLAPTLSGHPNSTEYLPGDRVTLTCRAPKQMWALRYRFFYQKGQQDATVVPPTNTRSQLELTVEKGNVGSYTCMYWGEGSLREISRNSSAVSVTVTAPQLTVSPPQPVYVTGEAVTLTCSAAGVHGLAGVQFFRDEEKLQPQRFSQIPYRSTASIQLLKVNLLSAGAYNCEYWRRVNGGEFKSERSQRIPIAVTDPPPQPVLSVDPPSGAVSEGLPLLLTCTAPGDTGERRFHFYKDGVEFVPREAGFEISTMEPGSRSVKGSVLSIPRASPSDSGEFTCGYEDNVSGRWVPSLKSQAVNVTSTALSFLCPRELAVGGSFCLINGLIFLVSCYCS